jgi:hypothetical protein
MSIAKKIEINLKVVVDADKFSLDTQDRVDKKILKGITNPIQALRILFELLKGETHAVDQVTMTLKGKADEDDLR